MNLKNKIGLVSVSSRSRLFTSRAQDVIDKNEVLVTSCFLRQGVKHGTIEVDFVLAPCKLTLSIIIIF